MNLSPFQPLKRKILAVCTNPMEEFKKHPRDRVLVTQYGLEGDFHCRQFIENNGKHEPNDRHITITSSATLNKVRREFDLAFEPGDIGENILVDGDDLTHIMPGTPIYIGAGRLRVTRLADFTVKKAGTSVNVRILCCVIENGAFAEVRPGDSFIVGIPVGSASMPAIAMS